MLVSSRRLPARSGRSDILGHERGRPRRRGGLGADLAAAAADQALIGRDQGGVGIDPEPAVAREHLHVEMQVARGAVGMVEIVRDHADLLALGDAAAVEHAVGIHAGRVHVHVAEADVLVAGVDLQRRRLLLRRTDHDAVADGDDRLLLGIAALGALAACVGHGAGADVLALMAETAGALADLETARFAEIVLPGIAAAGCVGPVALAEGLRADEGRGLLQRKADLRIGGEVGAAASLARAAVGDDVAARAIGEIGRAFASAARRSRTEYRGAAATAGRRRCAAPSGNARRPDRPRGRPAAARAASMSRHWIDTT